MPIFYRPCKSSAYVNVLLLACWLAGALGMPVTPASAGVQLFGTMEFRSSLTSLPKWTRVLSLAEEQMTRFAACREDACSPAARGWRRIINDAHNKNIMEQLKLINAFFNKWPYRLDIEVYGVSDYWATPEEFLKLSGDCEDYSITKYYALKQLGVNIEKMRIVVLKDRIRNIGHAVLAVYLEDDVYILDNLTDMVLPQGKYGHYLPQYSLNGKNRWAHVAPMGNQ